MEQGHTCLHLVASAEDKVSALEMARALLEHSRADIAETLVAEILHSQIPGRGKRAFPCVVVLLWMFAFLRISLLSSAVMSCMYCAKRRILIGSHTRPIEPRRTDASAAFLVFC